MNRTLRQTRRYFEACGRRGGRRRAQRLSPATRSAIASQAARARWHRNSSKGTDMPSVRLVSPCFGEPVYIEEVLIHGSTENWKALYRRISDQPFGDSARALERVLAYTKNCDSIPLWKGLLRSVRSG